MERKKNIIKIAITGGPCAGKSTGLSKIEEKLSKKGYQILVVSESATELINSGFFIGEKGLDSFGFNYAILRMQINKEKIFEEAALEMSSENIIILHDRGAIDVKAYCGKEEFEEILKLLSISEMTLRDNYDAVFHLKTAADGAEEFYTFGNNKARYESPEKARELDLKTIHAWTGHSHLRVIDNSTGFNIKINRLMSEIYAFLGIPVPLEIERKFLIKMPDIEQLVKQHNAKKTDIIQTYLRAEDKDEEKRIRQRGKDNDCAFFLTKKKKINNISRVEIEEKITRKEYMDLLLTADKSLNQIKKERYCFVYNNLYFELDVYPFWDNYAILEIELTTEKKKVDFPPFISIVKEVTDDSRFKEYSLSKMIPI